MTEDGQYILIVKKKIFIIRINKFNELYTYNPPPPPAIVSVIKSIDTFD